MTKIKKLLKILGTFVRNPKSLARLLDEETEREKYVIRKYGYEYGLPAIDLLDLFSGFEETVEPYSFLEGTSLLIDLALLRALARRYDRCRYFEIGTWRGESVANIASIADECVSLCFSDDEMRQKKLSESIIKNHRFFSKELKNVTHIGHDSHSFDFTSFTKGFDLIFIDGGHYYEDIKNDTQKAFGLLRNNSSVIVWHDYGYSPERIRWPVLAGILDGCPEDKRSKLYHVSNTLCAIYIQGEFKTTFITFPQTPNKRFIVKVSATKMGQIRDNKPL